MRPVLHLLSVVLVLPGFALAAAFIILGRAIATDSLLGVFGQLLADALWLVPWGLLASCAAVLLIALAGIFTRTRWLAGLCVAILGIGSTVVLLMNSNLSWDELPFVSLGLASSGIGLWFAFTEHPRAQHATSAA